MFDIKKLKHVTTPDPPWWKKIESPGFLKSLLSAARRDFCGLECLANAPAYAKTDREKKFLLWEVLWDPSIRIHCAESLQDHHPWVYALFVDFPHVRFPFNLGDTDYTDSLSWDTIDPYFPKPALVYELPRWSTASRSCLALVPENVTSLTKSELSALNLDETRTKISVPKSTKAAMEDTDRYISVREWTDCASQRFREVVRDVGEAAQVGVDLPKPVPGGEPKLFKFRLYSIKTGVKYVGSMDEARSGKNRLEANCALAMERSRAIEANQPERDHSFGVQTEVLTITAPIKAYDGDGKQIPGVRDGFQVRDLSCMRSGLDYIPGQAIPYAREHFDKAKDVEGQCEFWRKNFAVPLGRAKARLFLNYGLIHTSANAQNFILGFKKGTPELEQFVVRDIGDTSWHDEYVKQYFWLPRTSEARKAFDKEERKAEQAAETAGISFHLLKKTSSKQYPPPHIVRLDAHSVLTHGFADTLKEKQSWTDEHVYRLATGILDGFREFMSEALEWTVESQRVGALKDEEIKKHGVSGKYPCGIRDDDKKAYLALVQQVSASPPKVLFAQADQVRVRGRLAVTRELDRNTFRGSGHDDYICTLLNAEELLLCAAFDNYLVSGPPCASLHRCLGSGNWPPVVQPPVAPAPPPVVPPES